MRGPKSPGGAQASRRLAGPGRCPPCRTWTVSALPDLDGVRLAGPGRCPPCRTWTVSALPDLDGVRLAGRPQPRNRTTGAPAVERIAAVRSDDRNAAAWPRVGSDPLAHRIRAGHRDHLL